VLVPVIYWLSLFVIYLFVLILFVIVIHSVADPDPGSGIRDPGSGTFLPPGSGIRDPE
jgi:hypothetical protein